VEDGKPMIQFEGQFIEWELLKGNLDTVFIQKCERFIQKQVDQKAEELNQMILRDTEIVDLMGQLEVALATMASLTYAMLDSTPLGQEPVCTPEASAQEKKIQAVNEKIEQKITSFKKQELDKFCAELQLKVPQQLANFRKNRDLTEAGCTFLGESSQFAGGIAVYNSATWERIYQDGTTEIKPMPWGKISEQEKQRLKDEENLNLPYLENISDCRGSKLPERVLENNDHTFAKLVNENGDIYYVGLTCKPAKNSWDEKRQALATNRGLLLCPDPYADTPHYNRTHQRHQLDPNTYEHAFKHIQVIHDAGVAYNVLGNDCVQFVCDLNYAVGHVIPQKEVEIEFYKLAPKPLQILYRLVPLPAAAKRAICRKLLNIIGFNKAEKLADGTAHIPTAEEEHAHPLHKDLMIAHPQVFAAYAKKAHEQEKQLRLQSR
jgi:hypothetical protein